MQETDHPIEPKGLNSHVLYVDDEPNNLISFKAAFRRKFIVHTAQSADEGMEVLKNNPVSVVLTDQRMPGVNGVDFLQSVRQEYPETIRILITGYSDIQTVIDAVNQCSIYQYIQKPWNENQLNKVISNATEVYRLRKEHKFMLDQLKLSYEQLEILLNQA